MQSFILAARGRGRGAPPSGRGGPPGKSQPWQGGQGGGGRGRGGI